jgi:cell fate (sporulation/competence/biofilm development) regulator YlbF (YheA/YmcA/DUF963 family)
MKSRIEGSKNQSQEAHAIIDLSSGEILVSSEEIKSETLEYNCDVLKNNEAEEVFEELVEMKEALHTMRMQDKIGAGSFTVKNEDFKRVVKKFKDKGKQTYGFLVKAGPKFKQAIFVLCKRIIENEEYP